MKFLKTRPLKRMRHDVVSFVLIAAVPVSLVILFPYDVLTFKPRDTGPALQPKCAFVTLTAREEEAALAAARAAWQVGASGMRGLRVDLATGDLPPAPMRPVMPFRASSDIGASASDKGYEPNVLPPSVAASAPDAITPETDGGKTRASAFSREELLKID